MIQEGEQVGAVCDSSDGEDNDDDQCSANEPCCKGAEGVAQVLYCAPDGQRQADERDSEGAQRGDARLVAWR